MSESVRVQLLGPVRALSNDTEVALRGKTARTVLARLALSVGSVVSVDQLTDALWEDDPPLEPAVSLRSIISRLRSQLGRDTIVTDGAGYRLDSNEVDLDLTEIEATVRRLDERNSEPDELAAKLEMWNGDALSDVAWTQVFERERVRIGELRARLTDGYHDAMLRSGRASEALPDLERDAAAVPLRESTQLLLMRSLAACGRTADALRFGTEYRRRAVDQTGIDPSASYDALVQTLLSDEPSGTPAEGTPRLDESRRSTGRWLPPDTPFVGRSRERAELEGAVGKHKLVTIIGPGGTGKTRLAIEFLSEIDHENVDLVALAALPRSAAVDVAVATALGLETSAADALRAIAARLAGRHRVLVLDNCEHVLASTRLLVEHLMRSVAGLQIITTSRTRLGLPDESLITVGPLDLTADASGLSPPVELFLDRVARTSRRTTLDAAEMPVVIDVCRLLDGLPLALELAAARIPMLGFEGLRRRLANGLAIPGSHVADDDRRQATIEATVEWSLALLGPHARQLFDELSVFPSWFDIAALEYVASIDDVVDPLGEILDSSLAVVDADRPAYRLLQPIREVARRQLSVERRSVITDRYLNWTEDLIHQIDQNWRNDRRLEAHQLVIEHRHDLQSALTHLEKRGDAETHGLHASALARVLVDRADPGLIGLARVQVGSSIAGEFARCMLAWHQGEPDSSVAIGERTIATIDESSPYWQGVHHALACAHLYRGDVAAVARCADIAAHHPHGIDSLRSECLSLWALAALYQDQPDYAAELLVEHGDVLQLSTAGGFVTYTRAEIASITDQDAAMRLFAEAAQDAVAAGSVFNLRLVEVSRLALLIRMGRSHEALEAACRVVPELIRVGTHPQVWTTLRNVAGLLGPLGEPDLALLILDSANADENAPTVVGDAALAEVELRAHLVEAVAESGTGVTLAMPLREVWDTVAPILRRHI